MHRRVTSHPLQGVDMKPHALAAVTAGLCRAALPAASAQADVFNGRIAFSSFRTDPLGRIGDIFTMNPDGTDLRQPTDNPADDAQSDWSPDGRDLAIHTLNADGTGLTTLFDVVGAFDSAPAWSPDGTRIAFESNANPDGGNPEHDMEIWVMDADGANPTQLTHNALHDEGPA